jgi:hypothetical protein
VDTRTTTAVTGCTTVDYGHAGDVDAWGAAIAVALNTTTDGTNTTLTSLPNFTSATNTIATCNGGTFSGGVIYQTIHYMKIIPKAAS